MSPRYTGALATPNCAQQPPQVPVCNPSTTCASVTTHSLSNPTPPQLTQPQPTSLFSSPPSKVSKQGNNDNHELGNIISTFAKLNSPSKIPASQSTSTIQTYSNNITGHTSSLTPNTCTNTGTKGDSILIGPCKESTHFPQDNFKSPDLNVPKTKESDNCTNITTNQFRTPPNYYPYIFPTVNHGLVHPPYQFMPPNVNLYMQQLPKTSPPISMTDSPQVDANNFAQFNQKSSGWTYTPSRALCKTEPNSEPFFPCSFDTKNPPPYYSLGMTLPNAPFPYLFIPNIACKTEPVSVPDNDWSTDKSPPPQYFKLKNKRVRNLCRAPVVRDLHNRAQTVHPQKIWM